MLLARRQFSCGPYVLEPGDILTDEMAKVLPGGRVAQLKIHGWLEERVENAELLRLVQDLEARVARLEAQPDREPPRRGRPPKIQEIAE